ncbi:hypothetical protein SADUNF_Sadunf04G0133700 [Salix dunnii]|uniref:Uncharacterized protein n=1 Tax=Salix dunnii TaxID=1413687 RepID=A0A835K9S4_9ROSI|nr:hypothetical protein SADUNF_Sadunf04G0133700 [Salix dunnii]
MMTTWGHELSIWISFEIPDHVPDICNECQKPDGNCCIGFKCICQPQDCQDEVISVARSTKPIVNILLSASFVLLDAR